MRSSAVAYADSPEQACLLLQPRPPPSPHPQPQAAPEEHEHRYTILINVNIFAAFGGAPNERRVSPRERAKEEAKAKEVRVIGAKDLAEDRRMEAQQDAAKPETSQGKLSISTKKSFGVKM